MAAVLDLPTAFYYKQLLSHHPSALFILTVIDPSQWYSRIHERLSHMEQRRGVLPTRLQHLFRTVFGTSDFRDMATWTNAFIQHNKDVQATIPASQLLVIDVDDDDSMLQLCSFLRRVDGICQPDQTVLLQTLVTVHSEMPPVRPALYRPLHVSSTPSRFAYVCLLAHPGYKDQHGYFASFLVAVASIRKTGSTHDVIALIYGDTSPRQKDILIRENIQIVFVQGVGSALPASIDIPSSVGAHRPESTFAIYRAKLNTLRLLDYEMVLLFDSDLVVHSNCDHLFEAYSGRYDLVAKSEKFSPLNAGFVFMKPSWQAYIDIDDISNTGAFNTSRGWLDYGPIPSWHARSERTVDWSRFFGAHVEQGLLYYYYFCFGRANAVRSLLYPIHGSDFDGVFTHFIGRAKPFSPEYRTSPLDKFTAEMRAGVSLWRELYRQVFARTHASLD